MNVIDQIHVRRVINGRSYDTGTAEFVAVITCYRWGWDDFQSELTALYLSRRGQWFLAGEGGATSRWAKPCSSGNSHNPGTGIELIAPDEAQRLLEEVDGDVDKYFPVEEG
ncbi:hypothetical protein [Pinisolibacter sp.]|uniref:hypothetical protein n=1 Tax=Pinisolibacter sp. TaxID=2172024 RepID=UPI002FDD2FD1